MNRRIRKRINFVRTLADVATRRLVNKLILLFTSMIVLVVGSLTFISYKQIENETLENSIAGNTNTLRLVNKNLDKYFSEIDQISFPQFKYDAVMNAIQNEADDYSAIIYLENYLRDLYYSRNDIEGIYLYLIDRQKYYYIYWEGYNIAVKQKVDPSVPEQVWYKRSLESKDNKYIQSLLASSETGYPTSEDGSFMAYHRTLRTLVGREPKAVISIFFEPTGLNEMIGDLPLNEGEHVLFADAERVPFYADDLSFFGIAAESSVFRRAAEAGGEGNFVWESGGIEYLVFYDVNEESGRQLIKPVPYRNIYRAAEENRSVSFGVGLLFLVSSVVIVTWISNAITRPLKRLSRKMNAFGAGDFDVEVEVKGKDEIASLSKHFNAMVKQTVELINERYKMKLVEKSAILKALEAEINPHFLYNALQAISTKALKNGAYDVADMIDALALTLRYCISGSDMVTVREELKHIEHYFVLQKARYGDRLRVVYELDESLLDRRIPKLSVQTLIENSIKHALEQVSSPVTIVVGVQGSDAGTVIRVKDDGPGISDDRLREILASLEVEWEDREHDGIGLKNVHDRLKLIFGDDAQLRIRTSEAGTEVAITIPEGSRHAHV